LIVIVRPRALFLKATPLIVMVPRLPALKALPEIVMRELPALQRAVGPAGRTSPDFETHARTSSAPALIAIAVAIPTAPTVAIATSRIRLRIVFSPTVVSRRAA
jgi:hypothetical protein